jgi:hypothetical protein
VKVKNIPLAPLPKKGKLFLGFANTPRLIDIEKKLKISGFQQASENSGKK